MEAICGLFLVVGLLLFLGHLFFRWPGRMDPLDIMAVEASKMLNDGLIDFPTYQKILSAIAARKTGQPIGTTLARPWPPTLPLPLPVYPVEPEQLEAEQEQLQAKQEAEDELPEPWELDENGIPIAIAAPIAENREAAEEPSPASQASADPIEIEPPAAPAKGFISFMEESNIRWGEMLAGLLIVGCSIALVVSFWADIAARPWLQFSVFTAVTAAFFAVGLYSEHQWKIRTTSRGVLLIALWLVPLNFLAFAAFSRGQLPQAQTLVCQGLALLLLGRLVWRAGRVLMPWAAGPMTIGLIGISASLLLVGRIDLPGRLAPGSMPLAFYLAPPAWLLLRLRPRRRVHAAIARQVLSALGATSFAMTLAMALLGQSLAKTGPVANALCLPVAWAALAPLGIGLTLWRKLPAVAAPALRIVTATLALVGGLLLLISIAAAWPDAPRMLAIALAGFVVIGLLSVFWRLPEANWLSLPCGLLAWILLLHLPHAIPGGNLLQTLARPINGALLLPPTIALLVGGFTLPLRWRSYALPLRAMGFVAMACSLTLLIPDFRKTDSDFGTAVVGGYALTALFLAVWRGSNRFAVIGWILSILAIIHAVILYAPLPYDSPLALLTAAGLTLIVYIGTRRAPRWLHQVAQDTAGLATAVTLAALAESVWFFNDFASRRQAAGVGGCIAALLIVEAIALSLRGLLIVGQCVAAVSLTLVADADLTWSGEPILVFQVSALLAGLASIIGSLVGAPRVVAPKFQWASAATLNAFLVTSGVMFLLLFPEGRNIADDVADGWGVAAAGVLAVAGLLRLRRGEGQWRQAVGAASLAIAALATVGLQHQTNGWGAHHLLMAFSGAIAWGLLWLDAWEAPSPAVSAPQLAMACEPAAAPLLQYATQRPADDAATVANRRPLNGWIIIAAFLSGGLAIREAIGDPMIPWSSAAGALNLTLLTALIALRAGWRRLLFVSAALLQFAALIVFCYRAPASWRNPPGLAASQVAVCAWGGLAWLALELTLFPRRAKLIPGRIAPHQLARFAAFVSLMILTAVVYSDAHARGSGGGPLMLLAFSSVLALSIASLWDPAARYAAASLYLIGVMGCMLAVAEAGAADWFAGNALLLALAGYALLTAIALGWRSWLAAKAATLGLPTRAQRMQVIFNGQRLIGAMTVLAAGHMQFELANRPQRTLIALAAVAQFLPLKQVFPRHRAVALIALLASVLFLGWSCLTVRSNVSDEWWAMGLAIMTMAALLLGLLAPRLQFLSADWRLHATGVALLAATAAGAMFEGLVVSTSEAPAASPTAVFIAVASLLVACAALTWSAAQGEQAGPNAATRQSMVVGVQLLLLVTACYLGLVDGAIRRWFAAYWPLAVLLLALADITAARAGRATGKPAMADALRRSGLALPILLLGGIWLYPPTGISAAQSLLLAALFYIVMAAVDGSRGLGFLAALEANDALWHLLSEHEALAFSRHPQLWIIPVAVAVLAAAQLNRRAIAPRWLTGVRYAALLFIYVSSTADIFLSGVAQAPWLPLALAGLAMGGVMIGVWLRIRPFLLLGASFLLVAVINMIYFAASALHWTWIWYVAGILTGCAVLVLFALFEKRRQRMISLVENLRQWE